MTATLPVGFTVRLDHHVREYDGGRILVGGAPTRVVYLSELGRALLRDRAVEVTDAVSTALVDRLLELGMAHPVIEDLPHLDQPELTVVVPVRDRPGGLDRLLASIGEGTCKVVVDDCSSDPDAIADVAATHDAMLVRLSTNVGPAAARNAGLALVGGRLVAFVDSDVVLEPGTLATLVRHFSDPKVAVVAPRILGLLGEGSGGWIGRYEEARSSLDLGTSPSIVRPHAPVGWLPAACLVARADAIAAGFSSGMRVAEDVELVWRLAEQGWHVRYEPGARVHHEHRTTVRDWLSRKAFYGTGAHLLAQRHGSHVAPAALSPWRTGVVLALLAQRRWSVPVAVLTAVAGALGIRRKLGPGDQSPRITAALTLDGLSLALNESTALLLRHWWPLTALGCLFSTRLRRAAAVAAVVDTVIEYRRTSPRLDPLRFTVARRLDDLAYGTGLWLGALRSRSARALLPKVRVKSRDQSDPGTKR